VLPDSETCATVVNNTGGSDRIFVAVYARELDLLRRLPAKLFPSDHRPGLNGLPPPSSSSYLFVLRQQLGLQQCSILEMFDGQRIAKRVNLDFNLLYIFIYISKNDLKMLTDILWKFNYGF
jgi:hypothetical protein